MEDVQPVRRNARGLESIEFRRVRSWHRPRLAGVLLGGIFACFAANDCAAQLIISEYRVRGPNGASDEFIEIYNNSGTDHTVSAASGNGYGIAASDGVTRCTIPNGTVIENRGHYLCVNSVGYSLASYPAGNGATATGDATYTQDILPGVGIAIFNNDIGGGSYSLANRMDAVGPAAEANPIYKEGNGLPGLASFDMNYSFYRDECGKGGSITTFGPCPNSAPKDTNDNAADFVFIDPNATDAGGGQRLGAPGPQNLSSPPKGAGNSLQVSLLDPCVAETSAPNQVRDFTSDPARNADAGTLDLRRVITNNTGASITRLRYRIVDLTTSAAPPGIADLRPLTSTNVVVPVHQGACGSGTSTVTVHGTTLETPPSQPKGGGFNSSLSSGSVTLASPLAHGASLNVRFLLGVQQTGSFRFRVVLESLPRSGGSFAVSGPTDGRVPLVVNTLAEADDGGCTPEHCTLREALNAANANFDTDSISFAPGLSGTIFNSLPEGLPITNPVVISGPGAGTLTVSGADASRVFRVVSTDATITGLRIAEGRVSSGNAPLNGGAGILNEGGILRIADAVIADSSTTAVFGSGGGILNVGGSTTIERTTLSGNNASFIGGAIHNNGGVLKISSSTLAANVAGSGGGAIRSTGTTGEARVDLENCTFSGNSAESTGGAVDNLAGNGWTAEIILTNCTFSDNAANSGGAIYNHRNPSEGLAAVRLRSNLLKSGARGENLTNSNGSITSNGFNLSNDAAGGFLTNTGDQSGVDPRLAPAGLADNGGSTQTIALAPHSPAIDAGNSPLAVDQRGSGRSDLASVANAASSDGSDIGAFELQPSPPPTPTPAATPTPTATPAPPPSRFANIATRLRVETGENVLIGGLIITGTQPKRLIIRAIGPSLPNVSGALANPQLELYRGDELLAANDNWRDAANEQEIVDSTVAPTNDLESAVLTTLDPGAYTAVVSGIDGQTGVGSVEAYDLDLSADSTFANIATRGFVQAGADAMFGGLIITGSSSQKVIMRAIGPSLGIAGQLEDPTLELFNSEGDPIAFNDNWRDSQEADIEATTIPPSNNLESAIVATLPPAAYTAIVRGVNNTTGVALVEVYALD